MEPQPGMSVTAKLILSFALGLFVGVGSLWLFTEKLSLKKEPVEESTVSSSVNAVTVSDQPPGTAVSITKVVLEETGWVVIHEDRGGSPGNILGAQRFDAGEHHGTVELLRGMTEGGLYYAMLHGDDGDGAFDHTSDLPLYDALGNIISVEFRATKSSP